MKAVFAFCTILVVAAFVAPAVNATNTTNATNATNIVDALTANNLTGLAHLLTVANLTSALSDPTLNITLFAPNNDAVAIATSALEESEFNITEHLPLILTYHVSPNTSVAFSNLTILPTLLSLANLTNTTTTVAVLPISNGTFYIGGIIPGAMFNVSSHISVGGSDIYVINAVLLPPSAIFGVPLTVADLVSGTPGFSILSALIGNDSTLSDLASDPNLAVTIFAPTDAAFQALFLANNVTISELVNTSTARRVLLNHVFPDYPITSDDIPLGVTILGSGANITDTITINRTSNGTTSTIYVEGSGNSAPIPVISADHAAGMSAVHVISGVILPALNATTNSTNSNSTNSNSTTNAR